MADAMLKLYGVRGERSFVSTLCRGHVIVCCAIQYGYSVLRTEGLVGPMFPSPTKSAYMISVISYRLQLEYCSIII